MNARNALLARAAILALMALPLVGIADRQFVDANAGLDAALRVSANAPFRAMMSRTRVARG